MKFLFIMTILTNLLLGDLLENFTKESFEMKSDLYKINKINTIINKYRYVSDERIYGVSDYWATPEEFLKNRGGDCEDFAITKAVLLKELGVNSEISFGYSKSQKHLVLLVNINGKTLVLDNRVKVPYEWDNSQFKKLNYNKTLSFKRSL